MTKLIFPVAVALALGACQSEPPDRTAPDNQPEAQNGTVDDTVDGAPVDGMANEQTIDAAPSGEPTSGREDRPVVPPQAKAADADRSAPAKVAAAAARPSPAPAKAAPDTSANAAAGARIYAATCVACHGANGKGTLPGVPDFNAANGRLGKSDAVLLRNMINGVQSPGSPMAMPAKGGNPSLSDQDMANALAYIRKTFGR